MKRITCAIVGAQKSGTTALKEYLGQHSKLATHVQTEFAYFADDKEYASGYTNALEKYFYRKDIDTTVPLLVKNPSISQHKKAAQRLFEHNKNCKLVLVLRNPVDRAFSSFEMAKRDGGITCDFSEVLDAIENRESNKAKSLYKNFIQLGMYNQLIDNVLDYFPSSSLQLFLFEDFRKKPQEVCDKIFSFIGFRILSY